MTDCIFCKIADGTIPVDILMETEDLMAFKDLSPKAPVHLLIITKKHHEDIGSIRGKDLVGLPQFVAGLAELAGVSHSGYRLLTNTGKDAGQEIKHVHFHLLGGKGLGDIL